MGEFQLNIGTKKAAHSQTKPSLFSNKIFTTSAFLATMIGISFHPFGQTSDMQTFEVLKKPSSSYNNSSTPTAYKLQFLSLEAIEAMKSDRVENESSSHLVTDIKPFPFKPDKTELPSFKVKFNLEKDIGFGFSGRVIANSSDERPLS